MKQRIDGPGLGGADGRALRSERSHRKIVDALFELVGEGNPRPTAKLVAQRADLGIRTVFRHFADMDSLFEEMTARLHNEVRETLEAAIPDGPVADRLEELLRRRCEFYERVSPYWKATEAQRSRSAFLTESHRSDALRLRANLLAWIPECADLPSELTDSLEMVTSPEAWHRLRVEQELSVSRAAAGVRRAAFALCAETLD